MNVIRILGSIALWLGALLGVVAGSVWAAGQLGYIQPMVVISGSMEPDIMTGDLLVSRYVPTDQVEVGDVLSVPSELTGKLVTHRITSIEQLDAARAESFRVDLSDGPRWELRMKGDANADGDLEPYFPGEQVLTPWVQIPHGGKVVSKVMEPAVAMPILLALLALLGLSLLDEEPRKVVRRVVNRARQRDPKVDELDEALAAAGIDVSQLQEMDDLDLQLYALGIDVAPTASVAENRPEPDLDRVATHGIAPPRNGRGIEDRLWDFSMPPSDGIGLVPITGSDPPITLTSPFDPLLQPAPAALPAKEPRGVGQCSPTWSG